MACDYPLSDIGVRVLHFLFVTDVCLQFSLLTLHVILCMSSHHSGLVSTDKTTGNLLEEVSTEEIKHLRSFFDDCTSCTGPPSLRRGAVWDQTHLGVTAAGALTRKVFAKDQVVVEIGTVKKCIVCVVAGSLSARSKVLLALRWRGRVCGGEMGWLD
jgi:hypothetical protein